MFKSVIEEITKDYQVNFESKKDTVMSLLKTATVVILR